MAKPFIKWVGGKTQLLDEIDKRLPKNIETYVEPFLGGGSVLIHMLETRSDIKNYIVNDLNSELINCYAAIKYNNSYFELVDELETIKNKFNSSTDKKELYYKYREEYNDIILNRDTASQKREFFGYTKASAGRTAALFIFLNKTGFNGLYRVNKKGEFNVPFNNCKSFNPDFENIKNLHTLFYNKDVKFMNGDYSRVLPYIEGYNLYNDTFVYLDPPYKPVVEKASEVSYTSSGFDDSQQKLLKSFCDDLSELGIMFVQSNSDPIDSDFFDKLYSNYKIDRVSARRSINSDGSKRGPVNEIMIRNFDI